jgi:hypothetical protein
MPVNFLHTHTAASQDRSAYDRQLDRYVIRGVVGPDEFHTGYPDSPGAGAPAEHMNRRLPSVS